MTRAISIIVLILIFPVTAHSETSSRSRDIELPTGVDEPFQSDGVRRDVDDEAPWWESFGDDAMSRLIELAMTENLDVAASRSRYDAAEARADGARAPLLPTLSVDGSWNASPTAAQGFSMGGLTDIEIPGVETETDEQSEITQTGSLLLNLRYEVDLFGRTTLAHRSSRRSAEAAADDSDSMAASVAIQVGGAYLDAVMAAEQLTLIEEQIEAQESLLELIDARYRQGDAQATDVLQQRQQVESARANLPAAQASQRRARQRLAVFVGRVSASDVDALIPASATLPELPPLPETGRPADLLESRSDLRAARTRIGAARDQRRSAERAFFPTLGFYGQAGGQLYSDGDAATQRYWGVGVDVSIPLFRGLSDVAQRREAQANEREARQTLQQGLLQASSDVEGALASERENRAQLAAHQRLLEAARQAYDVARRSYASGVGNYLSVMTALATFQQAELTMLGTRRNLVGARLDLHEALGGGWTEGLGVRNEGGL